MQNLIIDGFNFSFIGAYIGFKDELDTDEETVSKSNVYARDKGKFKQGNVQGVRFAPKERNMRISDLKNEE